MMSAGSRGRLFVFCVYMFIWQKQKSGGNVTRGRQIICTFAKSFHFQLSDTERLPNQSLNRQSHATNQTRHADPIRRHPLRRPQFRLRSTHFGRGSVQHRHDRLSRKPHRSFVRRADPCLHFSFTGQLRRSAPRRLTRP